MTGEAPSEEVCSLNTKARLSGMKHGMSRVEIETFANPILMRRSTVAESFGRYICLIKSRRSHASLSRPCSLVLRV
jgi:protein ImuB